MRFSVSFYSNCFYIEVSHFDTLWRNNGPKGFFDNNSTDILFFLIVVHWEEMQP